MSLQNNQSLDSPMKGHMDTLLLEEARYACNASLSHKELTYLQFVYNYKILHFHYASMNLNELRKY